MHQVADEGQRVLEDALERRAGLLDVGERAGADHVEDDLEQVPDCVPAQLMNCATKPAEDARSLAKARGEQDDVDDLQRLERRHEQRRDLLRRIPSAPASAPWNQAQARGDRVGLLDVLPDLLLADQLHEAADQGLGGARTASPVIGILAEDRLRADRSRACPPPAPRAAAGSRRG